MLSNGTPRGDEQVCEKTQRYQEVETKGIIAVGKIHNDENIIEDKIKEIIKICASQNDDDTFLKINSYLRMQDCEG